MPDARLRRGSVDERRATWKRGIISLSRLRCVMAGCQFFSWQNRFCPFCPGCQVCVSCAVTQSRATVLECCGRLVMSLLSEGQEVAFVKMHLDFDSPVHPAPWSCAHARVRPARCRRGHRKSLSFSHNFNDELATLRSATMHHLNIIGARRCIINRIGHKNKKELRCPPPVLWS